MTLVLNKMSLLPRAVIRQSELQSIAEVSAECWLTYPLSLWRAALPCVKLLNFPWLVEFVTSAGFVQRVQWKPNLDRWLMSYSVQELDDGAGRITKEFLGLQTEFRTGFRAWINGSENDCVSTSVGLLLTQKSIAWIIHVYSMDDDNDDDDNNNRIE